MTKDQIKAELRRSACKKYPLGSLILECYPAYTELKKWTNKRERNIYSLNRTVIRSFILFVAEAL